MKNGYIFPKARFVDENDCYDQCNHIASEAKELLKENSASDSFLDEATDLVHSWETLRRMHPEPVQNSINRVIEKNKSRGYYVEEVGGKNVNTDEPPNNAADFAAKITTILSERGKIYDSPGGERSMERAVSAFNGITGHSLAESEGWLLLQVLKDVRQWSRKDYHEDSAVDSICYAVLKSEALAKQK